LAGLRRVLLVALLTGLAGMATELLLIGHVEEWQQQLPLVLLALALVALAWHTLTPSRSSAGALQAVMIVVAASGLLGIVFHYQGNVEFELEMYPSRAGVELVKETLTGATPVLAPGSMTLLGLVGFAFARYLPGPRGARHAQGG
jgi:hypothetical protein